MSAERPPGFRPEGPAPQPARQVAEDEAGLFSEGATVADRYRILARLGQGGMATVFRAKDLELSEEVALKVFAPTVQAAVDLERFREELRLTRQLNHPNIIRLFDIGTHRGHRFISMELLHGHDLRASLGGPMDVLRGLQCLVQVCAGLQAAHDQGVVHRDVKPENLFITQDDVVKVMDFGIAKRQAAPGLAATGLIAGTPAYMSPEQIRDFSRVGPAADLYSLGVVAYEMFTGRIPFQHRDLHALLTMHLADAPIPPRAHNSGMPEDLDRIVIRLLEKAPSRRFASCRDLASALEPIRQRYAVEAFF